MSHHRHDAQWIALAFAVFMRPGSTILLILGLAAIGWCSELFGGSSCPYDPVNHYRVCSAERDWNSYDRGVRWQQLKEHPELRKQFPEAYADLPLSR